MHTYARGGVARSIDSLNEQRHSTDGATGSDHAMPHLPRCRGTVGTRHTSKQKRPANKMTGKHLRSAVQARAGPFAGGTFGSWRPPARQQDA